ncbi:hypothetical protein ES332_A10G257500v1 [Gossypium tomentosum]|uniref:Uncharacterized protein n=1 Tax=Gossypium tomentosum TaxID=34277 RepID=A0A5D2NV68_GOSTO|nr:hypothetical protein ES332_A10G257500v1 [Gossypium tomentosum]
MLRSHRIAYTPFIFSSFHVNSRVCSTDSFSPKNFFYLLSFTSFLPQNNFSLALFSIFLSEQDHCGSTLPSLVLKLSFFSRTSSSSAKMVFPS